jgi:signal transduction histidine kinase
VDVAALVGRVLDLLAAQAEPAGVRLERHVDGVPPVMGDVVRLQQVLMNLVLNAIEATGEGWVRVEAYGKEGEVVVTVEDSGPGVPRELRQRVFEPFFTTKASGSGLGLPLVHTIIQQHGGAIALEEGAAGGARFVVHLPAA